MNRETINSTIMNCRLISILTLFLLTVQISFAQQLSKKDKLQQLFKPLPAQKYKKYLLKSRNELEGTGALLFLGYKSFISSQDMGSCVFSPSCSVYAIESFQTDNPLKAYLKTFDRLTRCHPLTAKKEYPYFKKTGLLYDPVH